MTWPGCVPEPSGAAPQPRRGADGSFSLWSPGFAEGFHGAEGALREARRKFVAPAGLEHFQPGETLTVLELAVGTGTNTAALLEVVEARGLQLHWWGLEIDRQPQALALADAGFRAQWPAPVLHRLQELLQGPGLLWGDARRRLPELLAPLAGRCDLVLHDAFSPRHCPELWSVELLSQLAVLLAPRGRLLTYCSAAGVRSGLRLAGLELAAIAAADHGRWSDGTAASPVPLPAEQGLRPLSAMEEEHLASRAGVPYRDPSAADASAAILARRREEQQQTAAGSTSAWRRRWGLTGAGRFPASRPALPMLAVAILAAGKGTRMKSDLPKVLQPLAGATLVERVLRSCRHLGPQRQLLIVGHQAARVEASLARHDGLEFVLQEPQNGTGHAVQQLLEPLAGFSGELLVLNGDVPLLRQETLEQLLARHRASGAAVTLLTARLADPTGYGRVVADEAGNVSAIVEHRDCSEEQRRISLTNAGIYCFDWQKLAQVLPQLRTDNDQGELYLTDTVAMLQPAVHLEVADAGETTGINDRLQLAQCEALLQQRLREHWMREGVSFIDPASCTLSDDTRFGRDVVVEPQCHFRGSTTIGAGCRIGPGCLIEDSSLAEGVQVVHSVLNGARVAEGCSVGPFAQLRNGAELGPDCRIGNFVEVKNSRLESGVKANHLSYLGDADLGSQVNIGAGTITANYDGVNKHRTVIGAGSKTGANSVLVAPIRLGERVTVAAGSTLTQDVPAGALAFGRARQQVKHDWQGPQSPASPVS